MSDLDMSVLLSRTALGLEDLELNDFIDYYAGEQFLGGQQNFQRSQVASPFLDGQVTTFRQLQNVTETLQVEVLGADAAEVHANVTQLIDALQQDRYTLTVTIGTESWVYRFEAADTQVSFTGPRLVAHQLQVVALAQRQPRVLSGASF